MVRYLPTPARCTSADIKAGQLAQHELKESEPSWRSEGYAAESSVCILDHHDGVGKIRTCNDNELDELLVSFVSGSVANDC